MDTHNNYTLESTSFIAREIVSGDKSYYANFHIQSTETEVDNKALPKTKVYAKWYPTTCDEEMKDLFVDVYSKDLSEKPYYKNGMYTIYWNPCVISKNDIVVGEPEYDPFEKECKLADEIEIEEGEEEGDEKKEAPKTKKTSKKKKEEEKSKPVKSKEDSQKTIDALVKKMNVALRKHFREVYRIKNPQQLSNDLQDEKDNITDAATKMYTDYLSRDDLKTLKSLKADSEDVIKYVTMHLEDGEEKRTIKNVEDEVVEEEEEDEEVDD